MAETVYMDPHCYDYITVASYFLLIFPDKSTGAKGGMGGHFPFPTHMFSQAELGIPWNNMAEIKVLFLLTVIYPVKPDLD